ncbi:MAG: uracil-DNA glycosylase [Gemmatimonadota bacterium]|nr:uracil-DNA glycosylase [Gemmatimonadota bacterium]
MDAEDLLRRYLEQRREMGERELVLDDMSVEDVMKLVGAKKRQAPKAPSGDDWRSTMRQAESQSSVVSRQASALPGAESERTSKNTTRGAPPEKKNTAPFAPEPHPSAAPAIPPMPGIVAGIVGSELFGGPIAQASSVDAIAQLVKECTRCPLYKTAINPVPGEGNPDADLMCVGEAPGATEDETGRPFVGAAGQLLTKILAAINLRREDVFICNVLKHRPPGNRNPLPEEVEACTPYLIRQVELIRPKVIVAFGTFAAQTLLETKLGIGKLRGAVHRYHGIPVIVTYHPAALLRNPSWKRPTWEDVQLARRILDNTHA